MTWVAVAVVGGTVVGSLISSKATKSAAQTQAQAAEDAAETQWDMFQLGRSDTAPWRQAGMVGLQNLFGKSTINPDGSVKRFGGIGLLEKGPGEFKASPSYEFALSEGQKGIQRAAAATGRFGSGDYLKDATKYAEGLASQEYGNFLDRYYKSLDPYFRAAGMGSNVALGSQNNATATGNALAQTYMQGGQAQAAGQLGQGNIWSSAVGYGTNQLGQYLTNQSYQNQLQNQNALNEYWNNANYTPSQMNTMSWL